MLPTLLTDDRKKNALVLQRGALLRGALLCALCLVVVVGGILAAGWEIHLLRSSTAQAQRQALAAAHHSSVQLVSRTLSLQSELDTQEDHDRAVLQLYLQLEREALPHLLLQLTTATAGCGDEARQRVSDAATSLRREMHAHSTQMLDKLQKARSHMDPGAAAPSAPAAPAAPADLWSMLVQGAARARARANELAADVAKLARADRQRLRAQAAVGEAAWSDEELEAPLTALLRALQRPNATFELAPEVSHAWGVVAAATLCAQAATLRGQAATLHGQLQPCVSQVIHEWEKVAAAVVREGGEDDGLKTQMLRLVQAASPSTAPSPALSR
eukprot:scaffold61999_cov63-Phaeocystis_antarctica.AAC.1